MGQGRIKGCAGVARIAYTIAVSFNTPRRDFKRKKQPLLVRWGKITVEYASTKRKKPIASWGQFASTANSPAQKIQPNGIAAHRPLGIRFAAQLVS